MHKNSDTRRPLTTRSNQFAQRIAHWLSQKSITPNQISILSIVFAFLCALSLLMTTVHASNYILYFLVAALLIQCRLLCNLFDGMVAIEGGKSTAAGELYNDIPDRISDALIFIAAGYAVTSVSWGVELGWAAALLAVMTAYVRTLATSIGAPINFSGPMAKQHRMALMTFAFIAVSIEHYFWQHDYVLVLSLLIVVLGSSWTVWRRINAAYKALNSI